MFIYTYGCPHTQKKKHTDKIHTKNTFKNMCLAKLQDTRPKYKS